MRLTKYYLVSGALYLFKVEFDLHPPCASIATVVASTVTSGLCPVLRE
jgi:hypothetical protein